MLFCCSTIIIICFGKVCGIRFTNQYIICTKMVLWSVVVKKIMALSLLSVSPLNLRNMVNIFRTYFAGKKVFQDLSKP